MKKNNTYDSWMPEGRRQDMASLAAAELAIESWLSLPVARQRDSSDGAAEALFQCAFNLLSSAEAKQELAQASAELSLMRDNHVALGRFMDIGATFPLAQTPGESKDFELYTQTWESSITFHCAKKGLLNCMELFLDRGVLAQDGAYAAKLLRAPEPSPLRQVDKALLDQIHRKDLPANAAQDDLELADSMSALILGLMQATASDTERLSLSIASADLSRSPLYTMLDNGRPSRQDRERRRMSPTSADGNLLRLARRMAFEANLFEPQLESHRCAMLRLARDGSEEAAQLCLDANISPSMGGQEVAESYYELACASSDGIAALPGAIKELCAPWAKNAGEKIYEYASRQALRQIKDLACRAAEGSDSRSQSDFWGAGESISRLLNLCRPTATEMGFDAPRADQLDSLRSALDEILLDAGRPVPSILDKHVRELSDILGKATLPALKGPRL